MITWKKNKTETLGVASATQEGAMTIRELADRLIEANRSGQLDALLANDYAADAISVEAMAGDPSRGREIRGIEAIRAKHAWWNENMDVREADVEGPFLHGDDRFAVIYSDRKSTRRRPVPARR